MRTTKNIILSLVFALLLLFSACSTQNSELKEAQLLERYTKIIETDDGYEYMIFDTEHNVVRKGTVGKAPDFSVLSGNIIYFSVQAGTGIGTQWGFFYDIENNRLSYDYQCISDVFTEKIAIVSTDKVSLYNIWNSDTPLQIFNAFSYPLAESAMPIQNAVFCDVGESLLITYQSGDDFVECNEKFKVLELTEYTGEELFVIG